MAADEMDLDMFPHDFLLQQGEHFLPLQQVQGQQGLVGQQGMDGEEADAAVADGESNPVQHGMRNAQPLLQY
jgi:hypothetical protein